MELSHEFETSLMILVNAIIPDEGVYLDSSDDYQKIVFRVFDVNVIDRMIKKFKFKDVGNVYDFDEVLPQPGTIEAGNISTDFDRFQRICLSKRYNSIMVYTKNTYSISCTLLVDKEYIEKFARQSKKILQQDSRSDMFSDIDFKCKAREYIEISDPTGEEMKPADVTKKKVPNENMVFEDGSTITEVLKDISKFFESKTKERYEKMEITYKRGIILWGDPGNGKSAMIRELIRRIPHVSKIVINPGIRGVTRILSSLVSSLHGRPAIIVIEDIDSLINSHNRSEFLNILDGVNVNSGVYFIGTTNYPEAIDPAFMNRSGRFDNTYEIKNPDEETRRAFFKSRKVGKLLDEYRTFKDPEKEDDRDAVVEFFVKFSDGLAMASLKEVMLATQYMLAGNEDMSIEEAVETSYNRLKANREDHKNKHGKFVQGQERGRGRPMMLGRRDSIDDFDDDDD